MKLSVLVPFRDRAAQLKKFIPGLTDYLSSYDIEFDILVVNQLGVAPFNKGKLFNIGVLESPDTGYTVFHDVDIFPIRRKEEPDHFGYHGVPNYFPPEPARSIAKPAQRCAGCIFAVENSVIRKVNGHSNSFWGWGSEDMDFWYRLEHYGIEIAEQGKRASKPYGKSAFKWLDNGSGWQPGHERNQELLGTILKDREKNYVSDGLNTCLYRVEKTQKRTGYKMIDVLV